MPYPFSEAPRRTDRAAGFSRPHETAVPAVYKPCGNPAEVLDLFPTAWAPGSSSPDVSDKVSDSRFQRVLNVEYLKYKEIFNRVGNIYHNYDLTDDPQETNIMNKAMTWYGIQMNTMTDKSNSNISELLLQGTNMGIIEGRRLLNNNPSVDKNVRQILDDFVAMQEDSVETLKKYL